MAATISSKNTALPPLLMIVLLFLSLAAATLSSRADGPSPSAHKSHAHAHGNDTNKHRHPPSSSPPPSPQPPAPALVRATCNSTAYYELCVSALGADPSSATADVRGLSAIAVSAAAANASGGAATAAALANGTGGTVGIAAQADATLQALLRACAAKYDAARDALRDAGESIAARDYDSAAVQVGAAAEYPKVCRALFRRRRPGRYPVEMAAREQALEQLCSVALDIIALLSSTS